MKFCLLQTGPHKIFGVLGGIGGLWKKLCTAWAQLERNVLSRIICTGTMSCPEACWMPNIFSFCGSKMRKNHESELVQEQFWMVGLAWLISKMACGNGGEVSFGAGLRWHFLKKLKKTLGRPLQSMPKFAQKLGTRPCTSKFGLIVDQPSLQRTAKFHGVGLDTDGAAQGATCSECLKCLLWG